MSKVMDTEYTMHSKGTDLTLKETPQDLLGSFNFILQQPESWQILGKMTHTHTHTKRLTFLEEFIFVLFYKALLLAYPHFLIRKLWFNVKQHQVIYLFKNSNPNLQALDPMPFQYITKERTS